MEGICDIQYSIFNIQYSTFDIQNSIFSMCSLLDPVQVVGLMSGTSLDGLDIALCEFLYRDKWHFRIIEATTIRYSEEWRKRLQSLPVATAEVFAETDSAYGHLLGREVTTFLNGLEKRGFVVKPLCVASHGHTIFHDPARGFTSQIGDGAALAVASGYQVVCDFRRGDVGLGGQGAPLVPIGDQLLFGDYDGCLNLGGIANVSFMREGQRFGWDISPVNMALNYIAGLKGLEYDKDGYSAQRGQLIRTLFDYLNDLAFLKMDPPKTLGREWFDEMIRPMIDLYKSSPDDLLATLTYWISDVISAELNRFFDPQKRILCTGGGAHNSYLISLMKEKTRAEIVVPDRLLIDYKEALIFAFLGYLRLQGLPNNVPSCTGASRNHSGGAVYLP